LDTPATAVTWLRESLVLNKRDVDLARSKALPAQGRLPRLQRSGAAIQDDMQRMLPTEPRLVKAIMREKLFEQDEQRTAWYRRMIEAASRPAQTPPL
jgi:hypothetical protein